MYREPPKLLKTPMVRNIVSVVPTRERLGKPYTGEWYSALGTDVEAREEPLKPFPSDKECICLVTLDDGEKEPDYACRECNGTGKRKFYSLYEQAIKAKSRRRN